MDTQTLLRNLPSVNEVVNHAMVLQALQKIPRSLMVDAIRRTLEDLRQEILQGGEDAAGNAFDELTVSDVARQSVDRCENEIRPSPRRVINATGIIVHTGLGRSLLSDAAAERLMEVATRPCALEVDVETGERGLRDTEIGRLLCKVTGAEAATVVNNNAAAVLISLNTLAAGKEVIVSRGQLVEIGGSFRIPAVMAKSGATLVEVGTTNKTRISDYEGAISDRTAALLRVHTSNFRIVGFTEEASLRDLVLLGRSRGLPVMDDLGSGALIDLSPYGLGSEPRVQESVAAGVNVITFSGDKLLGGPQAGLIVGTSEWIHKVRRNPLYRAVRVDKLTLAALHATLQAYLDPDSARRDIPTLRIIARPLPEIKRQASALKRRLASLSCLHNLEVRHDHSQVGGGSLPTEKIPTYLVTFQPTSSGRGEGESLQSFAHRLRASYPPVFCRIQYDRICLDMRTVLREEKEEIVQTLQRLNDETL